jgi:hypothetical protein
VELPRGSLLARWVTAARDALLQQVARAPPAVPPGARACLRLLALSGRLRARRSALRCRALGAEITFARGNYDQLVDDKTLYGSWARLALGKSTDLAFLGGRLGKIYALAAEPDPAKFATLFAALRTELDASPAAAIWEHFGFVTEIVLVAEDRDATRQILEMQRDRGYQPFRNYHRTEVLAAGVLGEPKQLSREGLTTRQTITATAIEAELAGDHARAIELLRPLVRDPSAGWEYGERAALIRNLAAAKRTTELADECKILTRPPIFRPAWIPLTRICKRLVR